MVDQLSGGRLEIGFGRGSSATEVSFYGQDPAKAQDIYMEARELIVRGLTQKTLDFEGKFFSFKNIPLELEPLQKPHPPMSSRKAITLLISFLLFGPSAVFAAEDQVNEILQEQTKARQEEKARELKRQEQLDNLKREQDLNQQQRQLDQIKQQKSEPTQPQQPEAAQTQRQLDQLKNEQQLQQLQTDQRLERIERERDPIRQRQQIDDLQRQQRIDSLQDQIRRNQTQQNLDRLRQQPNIR